MSRRWFFWALLFASVASPAHATDPPHVPPKLNPLGLLPAALTGGSTDALAGAIRGYLVQSLPNPLYESWPGWGTTKKRGGKPVKQGRWKHIRVTALTPADTLVFDLRNVQNPEPGRLTFTVFLSLDARGEYEMQRWESGIRLRTADIRARCRLRATLQCEAVFRLESGSLLLPQAVVRFRVVRSDLKYDNFVTEHIAGFGGDVAEVLGDALVGSMKKWHPSLERDLLARANAAIEKAADTKEVRISLQELLKKKGWMTASPPARPTPPSPPPAPPVQPTPQWVPADKH